MVGMSVLKNTRLIYTPMSAHLYLVSYSGHHMLLLEWEEISEINIRYNPFAYL